MLLEAIADVAGDLVDIVLSPEEIDSVYELLSRKEEEEGVEEMDVDREELHRREDVAVEAAAEVEEGEGSETESEPSWIWSGFRREEGRLEGEQVCLAEESGRKS